MFQQKTLADAKTMFMSALSDSNQIGNCKTSKHIQPDDSWEEMEIELPESYDWREKYPQCVQPVRDIGPKFNCSSSYIFASLGVAEDRICMGSNNTVQLSAQEILDCDDNQFGCDGGYGNKVLTWGKKKGFIAEECHNDYSGKANECEVDHLESNTCRIENKVYKVNDFCLAMQAENIKREIFKNGPVLGQMVPFTDFLAYKEGSYHKTQESFKFNGFHLVKIVGWSQSIDGSDEWIVENSWGESWGEKGYVKIMGGRGDSQIDFYALGVSVSPYTMYDYYSMSNMANSAANINMEDDDSSDSSDAGDAEPATMEDVQNILDQMGADIVDAD